MIDPIAMTSLAELSGNVGFGLVTIGAGLGIGLIGAKAAEATGRNPGASSPIMVIAITLAALIDLHLCEIKRKFRPRRELLRSGAVRPFPAGPENFRHVQTAHLMLNLIADQAWNPFAPFGVTSWEPFVANLIAFILMVVILRYLAFKPIQNVLEKRRQRIEEGEEMREESERQLASVKEQTHEMLVEAGEKGQEKIDAAKAAAARLLEEQEAEASRKAEEIIKKARQLAELEQQKEREALKEQFGQLVALAAAQVTGKMLTEEDQRRINREAIDSLDS